ncbi:hypothetical protein [Aliikangiella maris]|uniref:DUF4878 domain-containing protein n=2 Tax=Aliikangiella maris TaxID=3162458 RepID=A0ABV2BZU1_9GAMM
MTKQRMWLAFIFLLVNAFSSNASEIDFSNPESVATTFLNALKEEKYKFAQSLAIKEYQPAFSPDELKKVMKEHTIPETIELKVKYSKNNTNADIVVIGTKIELELQLVDGKWLMEF